MKRFAPTLIVAGLLAATATAFAVEEHLKLEDSPVLGTRITKLFSPKRSEARIGFRLRREEDLRLDVVDDNGAVVRRALGSGVFGQAFHQFAWDGRNDSGRIVPDGLYHVQLNLQDEGRTIEFPQTVRVDTTAPTIEQVQIRHRVFSPDGDGRADRVDVRYTFSEPAYPILYLDGKRILTGYRKKPVGTIQWYGRGKKPGDYRLALAAQDLVGNATSTREYAVRLRYVDLVRKKFTPRGRILRVRVSTDAKSVGWRLGRTRGKGRPPLLRLPVPSSPGRYTLAVRANGHRARATVVVGKSRR